MFRNSSTTIEFNGRKIDNSHGQYGRMSFMPTSDETKNVISNWQKEYLSNLKSQYGLSESDLALLKPALMAGASDSEILSYVNELTASHQSEDKNSVSSQLNEQRSAGYNPDLAGSLPSSGGSLVPGISGLLNSADLPSSGGSASLSGKFTDVAGLVLKTMSFGLQAYGVVSNSLMASASMLNGFATEDVLKAAADENGIVGNVEEQIANLIRSRGLHGRKAKQYASYVAANINSAAAITGRLRGATDMNNALYDSKIAAFKASPEYISSVTDFLRDTQATQASMAAYDLKIAKAKDEYLAAHPDMPAEELELALRGKRATTTDLENKAKISGEQLKQEESNTAAVQSDNSVRILKNKIRKIELDGINEMIRFCLEYERKNINSPRWAQKMFNSPEDVKYRNYKRMINEYYRGRDDKSGVHGSVGVPGFGSLSF